MYDYTYLKVIVHRLGIPGHPGGQYVGTCTYCGRKFTTTSMDDFHGKDNIKHMYRHHVKPNSATECEAGMTYYSIEYEKRVARENERNRSR